MKDRGAAQETVHLFQDERGSVSPTAFALRWPRMAERMTNRFGAEVKGKGLWLFIKESDNKIKQRLRGWCLALPDHLWQSSSTTARHQKLHTFERQDNHAPTLLRGKTRTVDCSGQRAIRGCYVFRGCQQGTRHNHLANSSPRFIKTPSNRPTSPQKCIRPKDAKKCLKWYFARQRQPADELPK